MHENHIIIQINKSGANMNHAIGALNIYAIFPMFIRLRLFHTELSSERIPAPYDNLFLFGRRNGRCVKQAVYH